MKRQARREMRQKLVLEKGEKKRGKLNHLEERQDACGWKESKTQVEIFLCSCHTKHQWLFTSTALNKTSPAKEIDKKRGEMAFSPVSTFNSLPVNLSARKATFPCINSIFVRTRERMNQQNVGFKSNILLRRLLITKKLVAC